MSWFRLSTKQTRTVYTLVVLIAGVFGASRAFSQASPSTINLSTAPTTAPLSQCQAAVQKATEAIGAVKNACGNDSSCMQDIGKCQAASNAAADATLSGANDGTSCDNLVSLCPSDNAGGSEAARQDLQNAQGIRQQAMGDKNAATQQMIQSQNGSANQLNSAMDKITQLNKEHRDAIQNAQNKLIDQQTQAQKDKAQAIADAQGKMDEINTSLINLRDEERKDADAATQAQFNWQVKCRAAAQAASMKKQDEIDKALKDNQAAVSNPLGGGRNQSTSGIFGLQYRRAAKRNKQILDAYNQHLVMCLNGTEEPGVTGKMEAQAAADKYKETQQKALDLEAQAKQRMAQLQATMNAAIASSDSDLANKARLEQQTISNADQDYQTAMMSAQMSMAQSQQNIGMVQQSNFANLQQNDVQLQQATRNEIVASNKLACMSANGGDKTQAQADAAPDSTVNKNKARDALNQAVSYCNAVTASCDSDTALRGTVMNACTSANRALNGGIGSSEPTDDAAGRVLQQNITPSTKAGTSVK